MTVLKQFSQWLDDNNPIADTLLLQYYVENDSLGNMIYEKIRDYDIVENTFYINNYNQSGLLVSRYNSHGKNSKTHLLDTFIYNDKRQLIKEMQFGQFKDDLNETITYQYNEDGQLLAKNSKSAHNGDYSRSYKYQADNLIEETDGFYRIVYTYNSSGQLLKKTEFYNSAWNDFGQPPSPRSSKDTVQVTIYKYDTKGKLKTQAIENRETFAATFSRYDNNGKIIEEIQGDRRLLFKYELY